MSRVIYDFAGERYVITGASSGLGRQTAQDLAEAGAVVLAVGRSEERLRALGEERREGIVTALLDVRDPEALERAIAGFVQSYGKLNGGVHAAGINAMTPLRSYNRDTARQIMDTSFWAGMELLQLITRSKYGEGGTSTVLFSSVCALSHEKGMFAYAAAKSSLNAAIGSAAKEICTKGHRVNAILPGRVATSMTERLDAHSDTDTVLARHLLGPGRPEDVSGAVLFLLSGAARWITGTTVTVDGGYLA